MWEFLDERDLHRETDRDTEIVLKRKLEVGIAFFSSLRIQKSAIINFFQRFVSIRKRSLRFRRVRIGRLKAALILALVF